ncbi:hypothetical protein [uncultured Microbacterium sp.]|uniref:hypothetical protein n=1 Tax=uncultured Microbacterium sp. TaxID=191216 RepID=UPI0028D2762C|nr:hypothetical protein [uncultured Microbacterium sp.]
MMTMHYTGGTVVMANDVAESVLQYARALAATQESDVLYVPVVTDTGVLTTAEFLVGPASQLLAVPLEGVEERGRDQDVIDDIEKRTRMLRPSVAAVRQVPRDSFSFDHDQS